jgi:hypothetical protein
LDFNLSKEFTIAERVSAQFRAEFFNALNRPNFGVPGVTIGAGFGQFVNTLYPRIIQFALKLRFSLQRSHCAAHPTDGRHASWRSPCLIQRSSVESTRKGSPSCHDHKSIADPCCEAPARRGL